MSRQRTRINRRANVRQEPGQQRQVFPRGGAPGNGVQSRRGRVEEVIGRSIAVEDATLPSGKRTEMLPTDGMVAAIQDGFAGVNERLDRFVTVVRQAQGLDAADEELEQLRQENAKLTTELQGAQQHLRALSLQQGGSGHPTPQPDPPVPTPAPTEEVAQLPTDEDVPDAEA